MTGPSRHFDPLAGVLSYLLPGLGQVLQGRIGKGVLFFVCLYSLFFYGLWLGSMRNVWLPEVSKQPDAVLFGMRLNGPLKALYYRPQFLGQFWMGVAVWPAVLQYGSAIPPTDSDDPPPPAPVIGQYMRAPSEGELNALQRDGTKRWDLGWVYTVVAGALNVLVICDAVAGPAVKDDEHPDGGAA